MAYASPPLKLPIRFVPAPGATITPDVDTGGYDVMIGGHGFRLATDQQFYYSRGSEPTTVRRFDDSQEPGEQSLSPLPWVKSQASFHGGAGQLNLEQGFTAFQYQQEQVEHIRFDTCIGVDVWTPGIVKRLPTTVVTSASGADISHMVTGAVGGFDYAVAGGVGAFKQIKWASGPDSAPTILDIDLTGASFAGASNCNVTSIVTDGANYYALIQLTAAGSIANVKTLIVKGALSSNAAPSIIYKGAATNTQMLGALGWEKARLLAGLSQSLYELQTSPGGAPVDVTTLSPKYTHPSSGWAWTCFASSPAAVLAAGSAGGRSAILSFALDSSGAVPVLTGGAIEAELPPGEVIQCLRAILGSFLAVGTSTGVRVGTFDTYTGNLNLGPVSVTTTSPVLAVAGRNRFVYASYTNQQADGRTGLVRIDLSFVVDASGRLAYAPDLAPPISAPTGHGAVSSVELLTLSNRVVFVATDGIHVEASAPSASDPAWIRTSRIRYDTTESKLFKLGRITGSLDTASIKVTGTTPFGGAANLGTFGPILGGDPGEFRLPTGLHEWIQMQFTLNGATAVLNSYQVKAYPAPKRQHIITLTVNCFQNEVDRFGLDVTDPETPRARLQNVQDLELVGDEVRLVEFTNTGAVAEIVLIDQLEFKSFSRPNIEDDFGGYITFRLRTTEN